MAWPHQHISASVVSPVPARGEGGSLALSLGVGGAIVVFCKLRFFAVAANN